MNHRERILAAIRHQPVDHIPTDIWMTEEVQRKLFNYFNLGTKFTSPPTGLCGGSLFYSIQNTLTLFDKLGVDGILNVAPPYIGPPLKQEGDYSENEWGIGSYPQVYDSGVYQETIRHPLADAETIDDLEAYPWPDPDWYDYSKLPKLINECGGRAVCVGYTAIFYYHNLLRGLELSLMDPILRPEFTHYLVKRLANTFFEYHRRCFEAAPGLIDVTQVTDDFGSQSGLLISPKTFESFYRSPIQIAIDQAKSNEIIIFHHDDGDMRKLLPMLTGMGIDVLNPIQWRCGNWDLKALKSEFGSQLCFHSAVDNQQTLPFGTPEDIHNEVKYLIETLASDHTGFIIGPCHNLQAVTPVENILALYQAAREYG